MTNNLFICVNNTSLVHSFTGKKRRNLTIGKAYVVERNVAGNFYVTDDEGRRVGCAPERFIPAGEVEVNEENN